MQPPAATPAQGIFVPPPQNIMVPKASSNAGIVELAMGMTNQMNALMGAIGMLTYHTMLKPQVVHEPTPPPRVCIPNCVEYSQ
jgi:hypothetical protein